MRWDMFKVIVERPRIGGRWEPRNRAAPRDLEDAPVFERIRRRRRTKHFNENLAPLRRYLLAQVNRPWAAVYAEICAHIKLASTVQRHVLEHLEEMVVKDVVMAGRRPTWRINGRPLFGTRWRALVYVCPTAGLLRRTPTRPEPTPAPAQDRRVLRDGSQLQRIRGVWYHVVLRPIPDTPAERKRTFDVVLGVGMKEAWLVGRELAAQHGQDGVYAASKRQIGRRALARLVPEDLR